MIMSFLHYSSSIICIFDDMLREVEDCDVKIMILDPRRDFAEIPTAMNNVRALDRGFVTIGPLPDDGADICRTHQRLAKTGDAVLDHEWRTRDISIVIIVLVHRSTNGVLHQGSPFS